MSQIGLLIWSSLNWVWSEQCVDAAVTIEVEPRSMGGSPRDQVGPNLSQGCQIVPAGNGGQWGLCDRIRRGSGSLATAQSRLQLLEIAGPGTILGLSESMSGEKYRVTAEAGDHTTVAFIPRDSFVDFL